MNKSLLRDAFIATVLVFLLYSMPSLLVAHVNFFDPVHAGIDRIKKEYENVFVDITKGKLTSNPTQADSVIYLVNIDTLDRTGIAQLIENINRFDPKVIGIDVVFSENINQPNPRLSAALKSVSDKLVLGSYLLTNQLGEIQEKPESSATPYLFGVEGFANFVTLEANSTVRLFLPQFFPKNKTGSGPKYKPPLESFSTQIVKKFDEKSYQKFIKHRKYTTVHAPEVIVYQHQEIDYHKLQPEEFYEGNPELDELKGKIVLIGLLGDSTVAEDKHYSPFNLNALQPDMNGLVIHANIIEMILREDYVRYAEGWVLRIVSFLVCLALMVFFIYEFVKHNLWFHLIFKLVQLMLGALSFAVGLWIFYKWQIKIDTLKLIVPIALTVDVLYFYNTFAQWLHRQTGFVTYFDSDTKVAKKTMRQFFIYMFKKHLKVQK